MSYMELQMRSHIQELKKKIFSYFDLLFGFTAEKHEDLGEGLE